MKTLAVNLFMISGASLSLCMMAITDGRADWAAGCGMAFVSAWFFGWLALDEAK